MKDPPKRPGTILYTEQDAGPVLGWLVIYKGKRRGTDFRINQDATTIGREGKCDIAIDDELMSREHARIRREGTGMAIHDLGSANGTFVNREKVYHHELADGDMIKLGETLLLFKQAVPGPQWAKSKKRQETAEEALPSHPYDEPDEDPEDEE